MDTVHLADFSIIHLIFWTTSKRACSTWYVCFLRQSTWSRLRHADTAGQPPLRTRAFPLGLKHLAPPDHQKVRTDNKILEALSWCAEQTLLSNTTRLFMMFPEDLGGLSQEGPTSIWDLREFRSLHGVNEACRGAGFMCQLGQAEFRRPVGILTNIANLFGKLYKGWPCLIGNKEDLHYRGPLPNHCPCVPPHHNLKGVDAADHFVSASSCTLGERFWTWFFENFFCTLQSSSLRDGSHDNFDDFHFYDSFWLVTIVSSISLRRVPIL